MIKKLTTKDLMQVVFVELFCLGLGGIILWHYAPSALDLLRGDVPRLDESLSNIYLGTALSLLIVLMGIFVLVKFLINPVGKRVGRYLEAHPGVDINQVDIDFDAAEEFGKVWVGERWTYSLDLKNVLVDNESIVWVYNERERSRKSTTYYLCLGLVDGSEMRVQTSEEGFTGLLEIYKRYPHIVVGNNLDYAHLFKNNLREFLDIKYNSNKPVIY